MRFVTSDGYWSKPCSVIRSLIEFFKTRYRTRVALAAPLASKLTSFKSPNGLTKVGVQIGSMAAIIISQRHSGDAGRQLGVTGMTDADACDIGEEILHHMYPAEGR